MKRRGNRTDNVSNPEWLECDDPVLIFLFLFLTMGLKRLIFWWETLVVRKIRCGFQKASLVWSKGPDTDYFRRTERLFLFYCGRQNRENFVQIFVCGFLRKLIFATIFIRFFGGNQRGINCEQGEIKLKRLNASCNWIEAPAEMKGPPPLLIWPLSVHFGWWSNNGYEETDRKEDNRYS